MAKEFPELAARDLLAPPRFARATAICSRHRDLLAPHA